MQHSDASRRRPMGLVSAWTLGVGTMVGTGIFALSADAARYAGPAAVASYLLAGLACLVLALNFGLLASGRPVSGGPYVYIRDGLGPLVGIVAGWQLWLGMALSASFYAVGFARYLTYFWPGSPAKGVAAATVALVSVVNVMVPRAASVLQNLSVGFLLLVLGGLVVLGIPRVEPAFWVPVAPYGWRPAVEIVPLVFTSYLGFEMIAQAGNAFRNPRRTVPLAMVASVATVTALYSGIMVVSLGVIHHVDLAQSPTPLAEVARRLMGRPGAAVVAIGGMVAALSSANGVVLASLELARVMTGEGSWPPSGSRARLPAAELAATAVAVAGTAAGDLEWLARGVGVLHLLPFTLVPITLLQLSTSRRARQVTRMAPASSAVAVAGIAVMAFVVRQLRWPEVQTAAWLSAPALLWVWRMRR
ncbi:APC family permease [Carboxydochorda subterranea]|uniref:APC family permease n=1 Tax=Carboxydichorda subterranea TaxID=3109565 RepID=A0ABZ1BYA7_9FIRM|nr:APC family permease [Limnochorda sp. L945t]WRP17077.1 APC family permease [Limnochorda sp. L945t]